MNSTGQPISPAHAARQTGARGLRAWANLVIVAVALAGQAASVSAQTITTIAGPGMGTSGTATGAALLARTSRASQGKAVAPAALPPG